MLREQWIHLFNALPLKLVTLLAINDTTSALPCTGQLKLFSWLGRCAPGKNCVLSTWGSPLENNKQCCFTVISFFCFRDKWIAKATAQIIVQCYFVIISFFYFKVKWIAKATAQIIVRWHLTLQWCMYWASTHPFNVFMFVLGQSLVRCSQGSKPGGGAKWHGHLNWVNFSSSSQAKVVL